MPQKKPVTGLDKQIQTALGAFFRDLPNPWFGKERDAVSRFVFGHLINECRRGSPLHTPSQVGIEIPVGRPAGLNRDKKGSWKDVVIWPRPGMTAFDENLQHTYVPAAVIEWKVLLKRGRGSRRIQQEIERDHEWLAAFTAQNPKSVGYSVLLQMLDERCLEVMRFSHGRSVAVPIKVTRRSRSSARPNRW